MRGGEVAHKTFSAVMIALSGYKSALVVSSNLKVNLSVDIVIIVFVAISF